MDYIQAGFFDSKKVKIFRSPDYNFYFDKTSGMFMRWGKTKDDDPSYSPFGPEILDLEITVNACPDNCDFCYKSNDNSPATNMTFETFKQIVDKMPPTLTQIAFGITGVQSNPDFVKMLKYSREKGIIPNFTLTGIDLTDEIAKEIVKYIGALAVSAYPGKKERCYNTVKKFSDLGIKQTNIHLLVSEENYDFVLEVLNDSKTDSRLYGLNAIVLLGVKPKGRAKGKYTSVSLKKFNELTSLCFNKGINFGFDSCTAPKFEKFVEDNIKDLERKEQLLKCSESCESSLFSSYINVHGQYCHCSFAEGQNGIEPVDVISASDFLKDVWFSDPVCDFRAQVLSSQVNGTRKCIVYPEINI